MKLGSGEYFGKTLESLSVSGLLLTEKIHSAGEILPEHYHENAYFCLVLDGGWRELVEGKKFDCSLGNVVYHPKEEIHATSFVSHRQSKTFNVEVTPAWFDYFAAFGPEPLMERVFSKNRSLTNSLTSIYTEFQKQDSLSHLAIGGSFIELFVKFSREDRYYTKRKRLELKDVKELLDATYLEPLSVPDLAEYFRVHPVYLSKSFKTIFGVSIIEYYRSRRIEAACQLLKDTKLSIVEIALTFGFYDQSHFGKYFRSLVGVSPLVYRNNR